MADSRLTYTQVRQAFDNLAWCVRQVQERVDGGQSGHVVGSAESTTTLLYGLRYLVETRMRAWTSDGGISAVQPAALAALKRFDHKRLPGTIGLLTEVLKGIVAGVTRHQGGYDVDEYASFWEWFAKAKDTSPNDKVLGEVAELMLTAGMATDPDYCVPPSGLKLGSILFSGVATAALTTWRDIDPKVYKGHISQFYVVARNVSPDEITVTIEDATNEDGDLVEFGPIIIANTKGQGDTVDIENDDDDQICSLEGATITVTGGKADDSFTVRVKEYRAATA